MLVLAGIAMAGGNMLMPCKDVIIYVTGVLGTLLTAYQLHVTMWLWRIMSGIDAAARATDRLFPNKFASRMLLVSTLALVATWGEFLFGDVSTSTAFAGAIAILGLGIFFVILHPQRVEKTGVNEKYRVPIMMAITSNGSTVQVAIPDAEQPAKCAVTSADTTFTVSTPRQTENNGTIDRTEHTNSETKDTETDEDSFYVDEKKNGGYRRSLPKEISSIERKEVYTFGNAA